MVVDDLQQMIYIFFQLFTPVRVLWNLINPTSFTLSFGISIPTKYVQVSEV